MLTGILKIITVIFSIIIIKLLLHFLVEASIYSAFISPGSKAKLTDLSSPGCLIYLLLILSENLFSPPLISIFLLFQDLINIKLFFLSSLKSIKYK